MMSKKTAIKTQTNLDSDRCNVSSLDAMEWLILLNGMLAVLTPVVFQLGITQHAFHS